MPTAKLANLLGVSSEEAVYLASQHKGPALAVRDLLQVQISAWNPAEMLALSEAVEDMQRELHTRHADAATVG